MSLTVEVQGLVKRFGSHVTAVEDLDLRVEEGERTGSLARTVPARRRCCGSCWGWYGLHQGSCGYWAEGPGDPASRGRLGSMGESAFYPFLSGRDNLRAAARRSGVADWRVDAVLERVSLTARAGDLFRTYSFGMKQRLGMAAALLKDPALLVLDEPSNGLDPAGQLDTSRLVRELAKEGRTVLLSSHDMEEVERLCERVGLIDGGRMLAEGTPEQLRGNEHLWVRAEPLDQSAAAASGLPGVGRVEVTGGLLDVEMREYGPEEAAAVNRGLVSDGFQVSEVRTSRRPLREVFLELTGGRTGGAGSLRRPK